MDDSMIIYVIESKRAYLTGKESWPKFCRRTFGLDLEPQRKVSVKLKSQHAPSKSRIEARSEFQ